MQKMSIYKYWCVVFLTISKIKTDVLRIQKPPVNKVKL